MEKGWDNRHLASGLPYFALNQSWHVAALGEVPPAALQQQLEAVLATGEPAALPIEVLTLLAQRREEQRRFGSWVERHHRPGKRMS